MKTTSTRNDLTTLTIKKFSLWEIMQLPLIKRAVHKIHKIEIEKKNKENVVKKRYLKKVIKKGKSNSMQ